MPISFSGDFTVAKSREEVYDFLTDPKRFGPLLPEFQGITEEGSGRWTLKINVGVAHIRGTASVRLILAAQERPIKAEYIGQGQFAGGSVNLTAGFELAVDSPGTTVNWKGEAQVFGALASLAGGLLEPMVQKNLQTVIDGLKQALN
ncbi:MAG: SRPBCC domain-containing protein [Terriglobales bacterium]